MTNSDGLSEKIARYLGRVGRPMTILEIVGKLKEENSERAIRRQVPKMVSRAQIGAIDVIMERSDHKKATVRMYYV